MWSLPAGVRARDRREDSIVAWDRGRYVKFPVRPAPYSQITNAEPLPAFFSPAFGGVAEGAKGRLGDFVEDA
jgi:hypothetical protein